MILRNTNTTCIWRIQNHKNTTLKSSSGRQNSGESSPYLHGGRLPLGSPWLQGSQSAAVFTLVSSAMGAGCLSFSGRKGTPGTATGGQPRDPRKFEPSIPADGSATGGQRPTMPTAFAADARQLAAEIPKKGTLNRWWNILSDWWLMLNSIG